MSDKEKMDFFMDENEASLHTMNSNWGLQALASREAFSALPEPEETKPNVSENPKKAFGDKKLSSAHVPQSAIKMLSVALLQGAGKYGALNWRVDPVTISTYIEAAKRHLQEMEVGKWEAEDGTWNAAHVMANMAIIIDAFFNDTLIDDRYIVPDEVQERIEKTVAEQKEKVERFVEIHCDKYGAPMRGQKKGM